MTPVAPAKFTTKRITNDTDAFKTVRHIDYMSSRDAWQVKQLADELYSENTETFCRNIWDFIRNNIAYKRDSDGREQLRSPARLIADRKGDCDCFSLFTSAILKLKGVPHTYRIVKVNTNSWQHIYVIVPHGTGYYTIDAVPEISSFDEECNFFKKHDTPANMLVLEELNGMGSAAARTTAAVKLHPLNEAAALLAVLLVREPKSNVRERAALKNVINQIGKSGLRKAVLDAQKVFQKRPIYATMFADMAKAIPVGMKGFDDDSDTDLNGVDLADISSEDEGLGNFLKSIVGGIVNPIRGALDKLGETAVGKVFRQVRDVGIGIASAIPGVGTIVQAGTVGADIVNAISDGAGYVSPNQATEIAAQEQAVQQQIQQQQQIMQQRAVQQQQQQQQQQQLQVQRVGTAQLPTVASANTSPEESWFKKNWPWLAGGSVLVIGTIIVLVITLRPKKKRRGMSGFRKMPKRQLYTYVKTPKRKSSLAGAKRRKSKKRTTTKRRKAS